MGRTFQRRLFEQPGTQAPRKTARQGFDEQNRVCAEIIMAGAKRYGDEGSLAVEWARAFLARNGGRPGAGE